MELTKEFVQHCNRPSVLRDFLLQAMDQNEKLEAELTALKESQRWRKYPDEKPNDGEPGDVDTVLVAVEIKTIDCVQYRLETAFYMDGKFWMTQKKRSTFDKEDFSGYGYFIQKVTHWMPLPKAPEEAE